MKVYQRQHEETCLESSDDGNATLAIAIIPFFLPYISTSEIPAS